MKRKLTVFAMLAAAAVSSTVAMSVDVQTLAYSTSDGASGLRLAWRPDTLSQWIPLNYDFVKSDFGPWGSHKKMFRPKLVLDRNSGRWTATWEATPEGDVVAFTTTDNFADWAPQKYFASALDLPRDIIPARMPVPVRTRINGEEVEGWMQPMPEETIASIREYVKKRQDLAALYGEQAKDDASRFAGLGPVSISIHPRPEDAKSISDKLIGIFFEDINYGADGGLYAELIQNRDFEYSPSDHGGWDSMTAWTTSGDGVATVMGRNPIHPNNPNYLAVETSAPGFVVSNEGFDGIPVRKGEAYRFSLRVRSEHPVTLEVRLTADGRTIASGKVKYGGKGWKTGRCTLKAKASADNARLEIMFPPTQGTHIDMVSLFPAKTFKGRKNGLRADLAKRLADLRPKFVRFPGGCVAHGNGIDNIYDWKGSIGGLEERRPLSNLWGYHQTRGLGYHEYFLFCEDIGAEPLPVLAAGVPCQNSGNKSRYSTCVLDTYGQQNGIPMDDMDAYIQDVLDLIEYANGPVDSEWGARRAAAGHPEPFNLKYVGIGNEDMITEVFEPRFRMIYDAVRERYPEITVIGTVGPFYEGADYEAGWKLARELDVPIVDEHYYVAPGWLIYNRDYYDKYPRGGTKVYLGEYASHLPGRPSNVETALSDALYLTDVERNADVVAMTSYAPLLAKKGHTQWNPDLIYFDNTSVTPTVEYYVQKMYGNNSGQTYVPSDVTVGSDDMKVRARIGVSIVDDADSGDRILKLVNMLPVEVNADIDTVALGVSPGVYKATLLSGDPADTEARPVKTKISLPSVKLPPYSFTVVRLRK